MRLPVDQCRLDRANGLRTAGFISGYEGSPLGGYDMALQRELALLTEHDIGHTPAVNEELAADAVWGSQHVPRPRYDGVREFLRSRGITLPVGSPSDHSRRSLSPVSV